MPGDETFDPSNHCGRTDCLCTHTECEKGWQWGEITVAGRRYAAVWACLVCDWERHRLQVEAPTRKALQVQLRERGTDRVKAKEKRDRHQTRVI